MKNLPIDSVSLNLLSDGLAGRMIDAELMRINKDLVDRGHDLQPRKLKIELTFKANGAFLAVKVKAKAELPPLESPPTTAKYNQQAGGYVFSPDCADNPDQQTIPGTREE